MNVFLLAVENTLRQFTLLFGVLLGAGLSLTLISRWTGKVFQHFLFPNFGLYFFGVVGIPVHEFSHAFFCKLFGHKVQKIKWFDPKGRGGASGSVTHSYHPFNPYHRVGHFFIGLGPVLLAPLVLTALFYALVPSAPAFAILSGMKTSGVALRFAQSVFTKNNFSHGSFYLFLYLVTAIATHMELSSEDLGQVKMGLVWVLFVLLVCNLITLLTYGAGWNRMVLHFGWTLLALVSCEFVLAVLLAILNLIFWTIVMSVINKAAGRDATHPFLTS